MKIVIIDNYDSFTYNLSHLIKELGADVTVLRNDQFCLEELESYDKIVLSPGPGIPSEAGLLLDVIKTYAGRKPIFGVCLGHQAIGEVFGARLTNLSNVFHGVATEGTVLTLSDERLAFNEKEREGNQTLNAQHSTLNEPIDSIFKGCPQRITMGRYHSWVVSNEGFPDCLEVTAVSDEGQIMALRHRQYDVHGIQFHPESVLTPDGKRIVSNWLFA